jgi:hypothetical protein
LIKEIQIFKTKKSSIMADQHPESKPEGEAPSAPPQAPAGSQVPLPNLIAGGGVFSPTTEKQVSDLLAEMQQYASTAAPGTTTTMQFSYQKSKHTSETSGQEPKVVESSHFEKAIHQTPPPEQPQPTPAQPEAAAAVPAPSIFSQIPQFLQEKLGLVVEQRRRRLKSKREPINKPKSVIIIVKKRRPPRRPVPVVNNKRRPRHRNRATYRLRSRKNLVKLRLRLQHSQRNKKTPAYSLR